jgi:hypothetical protein
MVTAYFDTSAYDHIYKRIGVSDSYVADLKKASASNKLRILVGDPNIEELLLTLASNPLLARGQVALLLELTDVTRNLLMPHELMVAADLRAYSAGAALPSRLAPRALSRALAGNLSRFAEKGKLPSGFMDALAETKLQKERYKADMDNARAEVAVVKRSPAATPNFEEYRSKISPGFARRLARTAGVEEACDQRGIGGLLAVKTIRMSCDANASLVYAQTFEERTPKRSDSRDVIHATLATSADLFVIDDAKFRRLLNRIPLPGLSVLGLAELPSVLPSH